MQTTLRTALLVAVAGWLTACAGQRGSLRQPMPPEAAVAVEVESGRPLDLQAAVARLGSVDHVYVAESHGSALHHRAQLEVLRALHDAGVAVTVGVEWLPVEAQPVLEAWVSQELDEEAFVEQVRWKERWGHDFEAYAPILRWARDEGVRVLALNAPKGLAHRVAAGDLEGLTPEERAALPPLDTGNPAHRAFFAEMMEQVAHAHGGEGEGFDEETLDRYYRAQLVWDEHMAREVSRRVGAASWHDGVMVVLAGGGHVRRGLGIPARVEAATGLPFLVVLPVPRDPEAWSEHVGGAPYPDREADVLWLGPPEGEDPVEASR